MKETKSILAISKEKEDLLRDKMAALKVLISADPDVEEKDAMEDFMEIISKYFSIEFMKSLATDDLYQFIKNRFDFVKNNKGNGIAISVKPFLPDTPDTKTGVFILELGLKDHPFIIDSLTEYLHENKCDIGLMFYSVLEAEYSDDDKLQAVNPGIDDTSNAYTYTCCILNSFDVSYKEKLELDVKNLMEMVSCVTDDFSAMSEVIELYTKKKDKSVSESLIDSERRHLFAWLNAGNVIILGAGEVAKEDIKSDLSWENISNPLGYVRRKKEFNDVNLPKQIGRFGKFFLESGLKINLMESSEISEVHKKERIQILFGRRNDEVGNTIVNFFHLLFTNKSLKEDALAIPLARLKVNSILDAYFKNENPAGKSGHLTKMAHDFFSIIPKSELFRLDRHELEAIYKQFLFFGDYQETRCSTYAQPSRRYARITFCMPRDRFSLNIFEQIGQTLNRRLETESELNYWFSIGRNNYTHHIYWFPKGHPQLENIDMSELEAEVANLTMGWEEGFKLLLKDLDPEKAGRYKTKYANVFGVFYQAVFSPADAITDIEFLETLLETGRDQVDLRTDPHRDQSMIYIFSENRYNLTKIMPHLQNLGVTAIDENTYDFFIDGSTAYAYTYYIKSLKENEERFAGFRKNFCDMLLAVLEQRTEDDILNGLLITAGLNRAEINLFILYRNYYWQIGAPYLPINKAFLDNPTVVRSLRDYFFAKFGGGTALDDTQLGEWKANAFKCIYNVETVAEDVIFRTVFNLMEATVRTNFFNLSETAAMSIKVRSSEVDRMPLPKPLYEIYVHGTHVEGIHLRGAMIARGGLRYSDRPEDFRTEILGLMNTQMLKNVVIVPEGSKGGFIIKKELSDPKQRAGEVLSLYKVYINSLLSLTDNIVEGNVLPAKDIVRYDGDDPYLVVAADKGTATFSDTANEISAEWNFWLGDAFASGGKHGYDHKGMGITAKGAWESVKFHFFEEGMDIQTTDFTVVGIGDMSGDVFGNGMLLSRHIRLVGAFNHIHIFVDPNPDAESSYVERERMFYQPGTTWKDYNTDLISEGGGVFDRSAKSIPLSPQIQKLLGVSDESVSGEELIRLLLQAKVDLLWNGGIGTYVKASSETNHQVGDAANDAVRIDANQLNVRAIGEGGNLGLTQMARLEAAVRGIKLNTDAIDNSGGVDTSDHEVNLKILMSALMEQGQIASMEERNQLLEDLTDDIAELVLQDNRGQVQVISMDNARSKNDIKSFLDLNRILIDNGIMDPRTRSVSTVEEIESYFTRGIGIPRPDLAILLSYTKMYFYKQIVQSDVLDDPYLEDVYYSYFPVSFMQKYDITQIEHPLKKEIIGTVLVNRTINQAGITLLPEVFSFLETNAADIIIAYTIIDQVFKLGAIRKQIMSELRTSNISMAYSLKIRLERFITDVLIWMLEEYSKTELKFALAKDFIKPVEEYKDMLESTLDPDEQMALKNACDNLASQGISDELAKDITSLNYMRNALETILMAKQVDISLETAVVLSRGIDLQFHFPVLQQQIMDIEINSEWVKKHRGIIQRQLQTLRQEVFVSLVERSNGDVEVEEKLYHFMSKNKHAFKQYQIEFNQIAHSESIDLSGIAILMDKIAHLFKK